MKTLSRNALIGYPAGIITGITYGLNPLFAMPLMNKGVAIGSILFFRYLFAVLILGGFLLLRKQSFKVSFKQAGILLVLGLLYTSSSLFLFEAYKYIASGLATTLIFLYPVLVAIIMVFLKTVPSWPVWLAIAATFCGFRPRLCLLHSHHQQKQVHRFHSEHPFDLLCIVNRCLRLSRKDHPVRHTDPFRYMCNIRLAQPYRSGNTPDYHLNCHISSRHPQYRCYKSLCLGCIRTDHSNPCRHPDVRGTIDLQHHTRYLNRNHLRHIHDRSHQTMICL